MIYYFSGTGNSRYIARQLARQLGEKTAFIPEQSPFAQCDTDKSIGIVCPVYYWGIPPIVLGYLEELPEILIEKIRRDNIPIWVVLTYGDEAGNALGILNKTLAARGLKLSGAWGIQSPNTYVLMPGFDVDSEEVEQEKVGHWESRITEIATKIKNGKWETDVIRGKLAWLKTAVVYPWSCRWGITPGKWHSNEKCIGCGKCSKACPVGNIAMARQDSDQHAKPIWGPVCTSCCGCYHACPNHAVEYGTVTLRKGQKHLKFLPLIKIT